MPKCQSVVTTSDFRPISVTSSLRSTSCNTRFLTERIGAYGISILEMRNSDGVTPTGTLNTSMVYKFRDFRPICIYVGNDTRYGHGT